MTAFRVLCLSPSHLWLLLRNIPCSAVVTPTHLLFGQTQRVPPSDTLSHHCDHQGRRSAHALLSAICIFPMRLPFFSLWTPSSLPVQNLNWNKILLQDQEPMSQYRHLLKTIQRNSASRRTHKRLSKYFWVE